VLPFENMSSDPEQEYFAEGIVEDIITALSRFKALFVIARNSSFTYKGRAVDVKQVGRELGVRYVLEGSVRKAVNRVRITGQLVDTATGAHLWADRFDSGLGDIFDLQDKVTESVVGAIAPALEKPKSSVPSTSRPRVSTLMRSTYAVWPGFISLVTGKRTKRRCACSTARLNSTPILRPRTDAPPYAAYLPRAMVGFQIQIGEVTRLARRAVELGKDDATALSGSGWALAHVARDLEAGAALIDHALLLNSNLAEAWHCGGWMKLWLGEPKPATDRFARAMRLSPLDPWIVEMRTEQSAPASNRAAMSPGIGNRLQAPCDPSSKGGLLLLRVSSRC
jgi:TolB-like protein